MKREDNILWLDSWDYAMIPEQALPTARMLDLDIRSSFERSDEADIILVYPLRSPIIDPSGNRTSLEYWDLSSMPSSDEVYEYWINNERHTVILGWDSLPVYEYVKLGDGTPSSPSATIQSKRAKRQFPRLAELNDSDKWMSLAA